MSIEFDPKKDYYAVLGVTDSASIDELKTARKTLVLQYHPDVNASADAAVKFRRVQDAFEVLADPTSRGKYDHERNRLISKNVSLQTEWSAGYLVQQKNFNTTVKKAASSNWQSLAGNRVKTSSWQALPLSSKKVFRASKTKSGLIINAATVLTLLGIVVAPQIIVPRLQVYSGK